MEEAFRKSDYIGRNFTYHRKMRKISRNKGATFESTFSLSDASSLPDINANRDDP